MREALLQSLSWTVAPPGRTNPTHTHICPNQTYLSLSDRKPWITSVHQQKVRMLVTTNEHLLNLRPIKCVLKSSSFMMECSKKQNLECSSQHSENPPFQEIQGFQPPATVILNNTHSYESLLLACHCQLHHVSSLPFIFCPNSPSLSLTIRSSCQFFIFKCIWPLVKCTLHQQGLACLLLEAKAIQIQGQEPDRQNKT